MNTTSNRLKKVDMVVLSSDILNVSEGKNNLRAQSLAADLTSYSLKFSRVVGNFEGKKENSFIVMNKENLSKTKSVVSIVNDYKQRFVLALGELKDNQRSAVLVALPEFLPVKTGTWVQCENEATAKSFGDYTVDNSGHYYVIQWHKEFKNNEN